MHRHTQLAMWVFASSASGSEGATYTEYRNHKNLWPRDIKAFQNHVARLLVIAHGPSLTGLNADRDAQHAVTDGLMNALNTFFMQCVACGTLGVQNAVGCCLDA